MQVRACAGDRRCSNSSRAQVNSVGSVQRRACAGGACARKTDDGTNVIHNRTNVRIGVIEPTTMLRQADDANEQPTRQNKRPYEERDVEASQEDSTKRSVRTNERRFQEDVPQPAV